jgi:hypothetical protein
MKKIVPIVLVLLFSCCFVLCAYSGDKWYENGNLHKGTVSDWEDATYRNKLATASDWAIGGYSRIKSIVQRKMSVDAARPFAAGLVACMDTVVGGDTLSEGESAAALAVLCAMSMGWGTPDFPPIP